MLSNTSWFLFAILQVTNNSNNKNNLNKEAKRLNTNLTHLLFGSEAYREHESIFWAKYWSWRTSRQDMKRAKPFRQVFPKSDLIWPI
jgi:hypothetical protein